MAKKLVLALESSTETTTVSLGNGQAVLGELEVISNRYSEKIIDLIDSLLKKNSLELRDMNGLIVGTGPGSFTGTRAGISTMRAIAQALHKPIIGVSSTRCIALGLAQNNLLDEGQDVNIVLDAKRSQAYVCSYRLREGLLREEFCKLMPISDLWDQISVKNGSLYAGTALYLAKEKYRNLVPEELWTPRAKYLLTEASALEKVSWSDLYNVKPLYWRPSDAIPMAKRMGK